MKRLLPIGMIILILAAWGCVFQAGFQGPKEKRTHLQAAKAYEEKELYLSAINEYQAAREYTKNDYNIRLKIVELYEQLGDMDTCVKLCRQIINKDPDRPEAYEKLVTYYIDQESTRKLIPFIYTAKENFPENPFFQETFRTLEKDYEIIGKGYDEISAYMGGRAIAEGYTGIALDEEPEKEQIVINQSGFKDMDFTYPIIRFTDQKDQYVVKDQDGKWKIVNGKGYTVANNPKAEFEDIGRISQGFGQAVTGGAYHLVNMNLGVSKDSWDYIGTFHDGYTAVEKGGKWALFALDGRKEATDYDFDDIKENSRGYAYMNECFAVKQNGKYWFSDNKGKILCETGFEDVKAFESKQPTAAMDGGKWGFVVKDGRWYLEPQYEDAKPYSNGYAPVKADGLWGYINKDNEMVVEPQFEEAESVTEQGIAPVKVNGGWDILRMNILYYKK